MKITFLILAIFCVFKVNAQEKDTRALIFNESGVHDFAVNSNEKIWITNSKHVAYADNIYSYWHSTNLPFIKFDVDPGFGSPDLDKFTFITDDIAIITGSMSSDSLAFKAIRKDGFYRTNDGGKTWDLLSFGGDSYIYNAFSFPNGNVWMGGSSGEIFYSNSYGAKWEKLHSPFTESTRMHYIFMKNDNVGVSGALHNQIYLTSDNWKTHLKVPTPIDQKKYTDKGQIFYQKIEKVQIWNNNIVVKQNGRIFYSDLKTIDWKNFPLSLVDFEINAATQELFAITKDLEIIKFTKPDQYVKFGNSNLVSAPKVLKIVNNTLYSLDESEQITKVNDKEFYRTKNFYTLDHPIPAPENITKGNKIFWGEDAGQILLSEDFGKSWYRYTQGSYFLTDINLINDSSAIIWDVVQDKNYLYSIPNKMPEIYYYPSPLDEFLKYPVTKFTITSASSGCFHYYGDEIEYLLKADSTYESNVKSQGYKEVKKFDTNFEKKVTHPMVTNLLKEVNSSYKNIPTLPDFKISNENKKDYLKLVEKRADERKKNSANNEFDKKFYSQIANRFDTIGPNILSAVFEEPNLTLSTTREGFLLIFTNAVNDSIIFFNWYDDNPRPWYLGWEVHYKEKKFVVNNLNFSKAIKSWIPPNFIFSEYFDNSYVIMSIANYLYKKEHPQE